MFRADFQPPLLIIPIAGLEECWRCVSKPFLLPPLKKTKRSVQKDSVYTLCAHGKSFCWYRKTIYEKNNLNILSRRKILSLCYLRTSDNKNKFKKIKNVTKKEKQCGNLRRCFNRHAHRIFMPGTKFISKPYEPSTGYDRAKFRAPDPNTQIYYW